MRKALVVGVNYYETFSGLYGCVSDAHQVKEMLERHADGSVNFYVKLMTSTGPKQDLQRKRLRHNIQELFKGDCEVALLYFAGHGYIESAGGYLCSSDCETGDDGISLSDIMNWANDSKARHKVIILDSCHSGIAGNSNIGHVAELCDGVTILTASTAEQYAQETSSSGVFTSLLVDALAGAAGNLVGEITPGSVYAHIDQSLNVWSQRPVFKTNVQNFVALRKVSPLLELTELKRIAEFFPEQGYEYALDPTYEPERIEPKQLVEAIPPPDPKNTEIFGILQKYNRVNLVVPIDADHMWHAAMQSKACKLTALGEHYRRLVHEGMI